jgi:uncharacterized delta-60 repeat protein
MAIQGDGKIVMAGAADNDFAVARCTSEGTLDSSFGSSGKVTTPVGSDFDEARAVAIQTVGGRIVLAGSSAVGSYYDFAVACYTTAGAPDNTFDTDGKVITSLAAYSDQAFGAAIQSDGKIVVVGSTFNGTNEDFALVRYTTGGTLDSTFGTAGVTKTPIGSNDEAGYAVEIQSDGKIVVAGSTNNGTNDDFAVARYTTGGVLDNTFGTGGIVTTAIAGYDQAYALTIQSDGKIVAAGYSDGDFALARYTTGGVLDASFGSGGKVTTPSQGNSAYAFAVAIQADDRIVIAGQVYTGADPDLALVRYTPSGGLDTSFGEGGIVTSEFGAGSSDARALAIQSDGRIVAAGSVEITSTNWVFAVARYWP